MMTTLRWTLLGLALVIMMLGGWLFKHAWWERYVWPDEIAGMADPPPPDRSAWPVPPTPWRAETQVVEVATPQGLEQRPIQYFSNSLDMDFVRIPPGSYYQAHGPGHERDKRELRRDASWWKPGHDVTVSHAYFLGAFEVTNAQFELFDPSHVQRRPEYQRGSGGDSHPVQPVTWEEAQRFARWLSDREGRFYRLPTEAEWEYAAQAGTGTRVYWGDAWWDRSKANLGGLHSNKETWRMDFFRETAPVGFFPANPWGLYDMIGNAYEWVADWFHPVVTQAETDPAGPASGRLRMAKGGSWTTRPYAIYTGESDGNNPADLRDLRGFRLLAEVSGTASAGALPATTAR